MAMIGTDIEAQRIRTVPLDGPGRFTGLSVASAARRCDPVASASGRVVWEHARCVPEYGKQGQHQALHHPEFEPATQFSTLAQSYE
jgi:hypothetical protein